MTARSTPLPTARTRRLGAALAVATALVIAAATLTPQPIGTDDPATMSPWCLVCGRLGGADVVSNVLLFLPLGFGLALAGVRWRVAALLALVASIGIELAQLLLIPGRWGTLSDVLTNTAGAAVGAALAWTRAAWLRPRPHAAAELAALAAATWVAVLAFTIWALRRDPAPGPWPPALPSAEHPFRTGYGWFDGRVEEATLDGQTVAHRGTGPLVVAAATGRDIALRLRVRGGEDGLVFVPMLFVHGQTAGMQAMVGQRDRTLGMRVRLRAAALRLRTPDVNLPDAYPFRGGDTATVHEIRGGVGGDSLVLGLDGSIRRVVRLTPTLGWTLLLPFVRADRAERDAVTFLWLAALLLPTGYWVAVWAGGRGSLLAAVLVMVVAAGLGAVPAVARARPAEWWEWGAAAAGAGAGAAASLLGRRGRNTRVAVVPDRSR